ncbi:MAG: energy-coupling factor transporter transmembrane component T [Lachnospiraceae bacterium]
MIRDITIGQYYPSKSILHSLDPRVKIVCTLFYLISLFLFKSILGYALATLFLFTVIKISKVPLKFIFKGLKAIIMLLMITVVFNLFLIEGGKILLHVWIFKITESGLRTAVYMAIRLIYLIVGSSLMTLTTTPNALTDGIESLLGPLNKIKVPVHEIAMMMSIALRFIPILLEETDKIMKAQIARGADLESGNIIRRAKSMIPILVPLFVSAFRRANDLAMAMESRCYRGGEGRTKMKPLVYHRKDYIAYLVTISYVVIVFVVGRFIPFRLWIF